MNSGATVWPLFNSLQAFWPGLQVWIIHISERLLQLCSPYST
uniref:Uncharacterized protein n=1 Tax=Arundo donax TaxID=35708 RepID=A0A0A9E5X5_ARUDO